MLEAAPCNVNKLAWRLMKSLQGWMARTLHCSARKLLRISLAELADMARDFSSKLDPSSAEVSDLPSTDSKTQAHTFKPWFSSLSSQCEIFWS